jgi:hypothetical protein
MKVLLALYVLLLASAAEAEKVRDFLDGNILWGLCSSPTDSEGGVACRVYVAGVADTFAVYAPHKFCLPANATEIQIADVVTKYLRDHPESRQYTAESEVEAALSVAFPCRKTSGKQPDWMSAPLATDAAP